VLIKLSKGYYSIVNATIYFSVCNPESRHSQTESKHVKKIILCDVFVMYAVCYI